MDGRDIVTNYSYTEAGGALTDIAYPADSSQDVSFGYDALGRRTSMSDAEGSHAYGYDDAGTLLSHAVTYTSLSAKTVSYTYYDNGSRATMTTPAGTQTYGYDAAGRMTSLQYGLGTASWQYLDNNLLSQQTLPNGCYTDYAYNAANQLTDLVNKTSGGNTLSGYLDFLYLGTGDLATVTSSIPGSTSLQGQVDYGYDHKRQLTLEDSDRNGGYSDANSFDGAGNATKFRNASKTYNADNQLTGPGTYVYDGNGNPTTWSGTSLTFDVENRMTAYGTTLTAGYRGDGLRAWKNTASGQTYFLYDGISVVCELDSGGSVTAGSTYGAAGLLSRGSVQYQFDNLGDATIRLDGSGNVLSYRLFDAWGNELSSVSEPYGYRARYGYYADSETGLIALAYRYYAPGVGRFLNRDPIFPELILSLYAYAENGPVAYVDEWGFQASPDTPAGRWELWRLMWEEARDLGIPIWETSWWESFTGRGWQLHHLLPREFRSTFNRILGKGAYNRYCVRVPAWFNRVIHETGYYNAWWAWFFKRYPNATPAEVIRFMDEMLRGYGLKGLPIVPYR